MNWLAQAGGRTGKYESVVRGGSTPSLFDAAAVTRFWGSREKDYRRGMVRAFDDAETARKAADRLIRAKVRGKYQVVGHRSHDGAQAGRDGSDDGRPVGRSIRGHAAGALWAAESAWRVRRGGLTSAW
jgi:predicted DNA-binding WGR domain protein